MYDSRKLLDPAVKVHFKLQLSDRSEEVKPPMEDIEEHWQFFQEASVDAARTTMGIRGSKKEEWL